MSLPAGEQRILDEIESGLRADEPHLASKYAIFARLTTGEPKPVREVIRGRLRRRGRRRQRFSLAHTSPSRARVIALLPVVLITLLSALAIGLSHGGGNCRPVSLQLRAGVVMAPVMCHRQVRPRVPIKLGGP